MAKATTAKAAPQMVIIPKIEEVRINVWVIGDTPLICHNWSEKAKKQMRDKQMGKATKKKAPKDPDEDFRESLYTIDRDACVFGFPAIAFKAAAVAACRMTDVKMTEARNFFHITGPELVRIHGVPKMREDMVRLNGKTADLRYRGEFTKWAAEIPISYEATTITADQLYNLINLAGYGVGVGEWRPEKNGPFGRFHVATEGEELPYIDGSAFSDAA